MIFCRFSRDGDPSFGVVEDHAVAAIAPDPFQAYETVSDPVPLSEVRLLAPVLPSKIVAVGLNYRDHAGEMGMEVPTEPVLFLKPPSSVIGPEEPIRLPKLSRRVEFEGELAVVIKKKARNLAPAEAMDAVLGFTCFNDVTARDLQKKDGQWSRAKGFDTFAPIGPWIVADLGGGPLAIETFLNGERRQRGSTADLIFNVPELVSRVSHVMTLEPGDVISTGTPSGVGPLSPGDLVDVKIEGIGTLRNPVESGA
ncbi:MAG: hypothetical protein A2902_06635 [Elusimicrobia bacterium RIFCSPLOWO2_01_FULL_64_13]|nr:MAG: hypothetical protein A2636_03855 [Elusimicrobia bacterium RIFCSPHIGHO2_01_FULL_64_10]OGR97621.1 MAG: hypothetical protein A2902_06635 [Elusimicrobia bacterium RIFCSPLOWO2_01_FULL_64_13]